MSAEVGILVTNLGTPERADKKALQTYLAEFLSDPRIIEIPKFVWWPILHGIILRLRPARSAELYKEIWLEQGSPLLVYSQSVVDKLQALYDSSVVKVILGMRYGNPSIAKALQELKETGVKRIIVLPLYPQYSAATVASTFDAVTACLRKWRDIPACDFIMGYADHQAYISALSESIKPHLQAKDYDQLLFSFHGIPERCVKLGDPYAEQAKLSAKLIAEHLNLSQSQWQLVFQSRFGKAKWLTPYCDKTLEVLPSQGIKKIAIACPGFAVDCLETLQEIAMENRDIFLEAGGEVYDYIPALNDSDAHIDCLAAVLQHYLKH